MTIKEFILSLLWLVSFDCIVGFLLYLFWRYLDLQFFSDFEISTLKQENEYLKNENRKINGTSTDFWDRGRFDK